jgi:hypothetical protein
MRTIDALGAVAACLVVVVCAGNSGPEWEEPCDAGALPDGATPITGPVRDLETIRGELRNCSSSPDADGQDMFVIFIADPDTFSASVDPAETEFDTQLWLFNESKGRGFGLLGNDDDPANPPFSRFGNAANDDSGAMVKSRGFYFLAISGFDSDPFSSSGNIYFQKTRTEISGPDGEGGSSPIDRWEPSVGDKGSYAIKVTGVTFIECPSDIDFNGFVDFEDIIHVLSAWGPCAVCREDINNDGDVDTDDVSRVLSDWGRCGI